MHGVVVLENEPARRRVVLVVREVTHGVAHPRAVAERVVAVARRVVGIGRSVRARRVIGMDLSAVQFLLLSQAIIFVLGWPLEWTEIIVIFCVRGHHGFLRAGAQSTENRALSRSRARI